MNLIYFSPHHKNKFVNSVNSLNNSLATLAETKKANMLDFTRSGLPNVSQSKSKFTTFLWSDNCSSLFTDYTNFHLSLNMLQLNSILIYHMQCIVRYIVLSGLSKYWFRTLVRRKHFCTKMWLSRPEANVCKHQPTVCRTLVWRFVRLQTVV